MSDSLDLRKQQFTSDKKQLDADLKQAQKDRADAAIKLGPFSRISDKERAKLKEELRIADQNFNTIKSNLDSFNNDQAKTLAEDTDVLKQSESLKLDLRLAESQVDETLGEAGNLGRIRDDAAVIESRQAYSDATNLSLQRDQATRQLNAAEGSQNRQLASALSSAGVKGGAAGAAYTDLASANLRNRNALEQDLAAQNINANKERANFELGLAQFDLGQSNAEKNLRLQTKLGLTQFNQSVRAGVSQEDIANQIGSQGGGGGGTVLCTAMFHHGLIDKDAFYYDIQAGKTFLLNRSTRKAFLLYNKVCKPIANYAIKNRWFALLISPIVVPIAKHFKDNNKLGRFLFAALSAPFKLAAKVL